MWKLYVTSNGGGGGVAGVGGREYFMTVSNGHSQVVNIAHILYNIAIFSHFCLKKKKKRQRAAL